MKSITTLLLLLGAAALCSCSESEFDREYLLQEEAAYNGTTRNDSTGDGTGRSAVSIVIEDDIEEVNIDFSLGL